MAQRVKNPTSIPEDIGLILFLSQWVKDPALLYATAQVMDLAWIWCGYGCVEAGSCSPDSTPSLGTSTCLRCGPKKEKQRIEIRALTTIYMNFPRETLASRVPLCFLGITEIKSFLHEKWRY